MPKVTHDQVAIVITARYNSSRLFHKPLIKINGKTLVQSVVDECLKVTKVKSVIVTSESSEVLDSIEGNINKILTSDLPTSGSERLAEVSKIIDSNAYALVPCDIWPLSVSVIENFIDTMVQAESEFGTLTGDLLDQEELFDPSIVKSLLDKESNALWFSRIPFLSKTTFTPQLGQYVKKQLGMYWYTKISIDTFSNLPLTPCEIVESNESLRVLQNCYKMKCFTTNIHIECLNTPEDIERVHTAWKAVIHLPPKGDLHTKLAYTLFAPSQCLADAKSTDEPEQLMVLQSKQTPTTATISLRN